LTSDFDDPLPMKTAAITDRMLVTLFSLLLVFTAVAVQSDAGRQGRAFLLDEGLAAQRCGPARGEMLPGADVIAPAGTAMRVDAGGFELDQNKKITLFTGDVTLAKGGQTMMSDQARYFQREDRLALKGDLFYRDASLRMLADEGEFYPDENRGSITHIRGYRLPRGGARGDADSAVLHDKDRSSYVNASYTTCPPENIDWVLRADRVDMDQAEGVAVARNTTIKFKGVPILYSPYFSYPIDSRRKSGFLAPRIASLSTTGLDITTPYYLNLAPNYDATLYPRYMADHGVMLGGEFRFMTPVSHGELKGQFIRDRQPPVGIDDSRGSFSLRHWANPAPRWATRLHGDYVSDTDYISDFGSHLGVTSTVHLERTAEAIYYGDNWSFISRLQNFQTVDSTFLPSQRPYSRLPQFLLNADIPSDIGLVYHMRGELALFDRDDTVDGQRVDLMPGISLPILRPWGHFIPKANLRYTAYNLDNPAAGKPSDPDRSLSIFSVDTGLMFEREASWFGQTSLQTLEPRVFYLYTPYEDQDDQPIFDTAAYGLSFDSLFRENRFTGADRQGDANQVTAALTTRIMSSQSGAEWLSASLGQIYSFEDRRVQMPDANGIPLPVETTMESSVVGQLAGQLTPEWEASAYLQWNPGQNVAEKGSAQVQYHDDEQRIFNLAYRYEDNPVDVASYQKQIDTSFHLPLASNWNLVGRWNYSLHDKKTLDRFAGIEYDSCCWALRFVGRNFANNDESTNALFLQLELKGLGSIGHRADKEIENGVLGYKLD
jgi:LPS-assembly protein